MSPDSAEKIEQLLKETGVAFERAGDAAWSLSAHPDTTLKASLVCLPSASTRDADLLKIYLPVGKLPEDAGVDFYRELLRKNRDLGHGGFALAGRDTVVFVDTLELEHCDTNEMQATLGWLLQSVDIFKQKLDFSKLPYLEPY